MNIKYMELALEEAKKAEMIDEVPIGCVIVKNNEVICKTHNLRHTTKRSIAHAEIVAIDEACKLLKTWHLDECDLYVTVEPCPMCAGAIMQSRIKNVYYGTKDNKGGSYGSNFNLNEIKGLNHYPNVEGGFLNTECSRILINYFKRKRKKTENISDK